MGGRIGVESRVGVGSTFWIEIPFEPLHTHNLTPTLYSLPPSISEKLQSLKIGIYSNDAYYDLLKQYLSFWKLDFNRIQSIDQVHDFDLVLIDSDFDFLQAFLNKPCKGRCVLSKQAILFCSLSLLSPLMSKVQRKCYENQILIVTKPLGPLKLFQALKNTQSPTNCQKSTKRTIICSDQTECCKKASNKEMESIEDMESLDKIVCAKDKEHKVIKETKESPIIKQRESGIIFDSRDVFYLENSAKETTDNFEIYTKRILTHCLENKVAQPPLQNSHPKVLVVEDNNVNQMIMIKQLEKLHVPFEVTASGEEGVEIWKKSNPHIQLVFMDVEVDGTLDGLECTAKIRELEKQFNEENANTPGFTPIHTYIVIMTGRSLEEDHSEAFSFGCDEFLTKPVNLKTIVNLVSWKLHLMES